MNQIIADFMRIAAPRRRIVDSARLPLLLLGWLAAKMVSVSDAVAQVSFGDVSVGAGMLAYPFMDGDGGGVAAADFDDDGDIDIFLPTYVGTPNRLYRNLGNGVFQKIAAAAGLADTA